MTALTRAQIENILKDAEVAEGLGVNVNTPAWMLVIIQQVRDLATMALGLMKYAEEAEASILQVAAASEARVKALEEGLREAPLPFWNRNRCRYCPRTWEDALCEQHADDCWWPKSRALLSERDDFGKGVRLCANCPHAVHERECGFVSDRDESDFGVYAGTRCYCSPLDQTKHGRITRQEYDDTWVPTSERADGLRVFPHRDRCCTFDISERDLEKGGTLTEVLANADPSYRRSSAAERSTERNAASRHLATERDLKKGVPSDASR